MSEIILLIGYICNERLGSNSFLVPLAIGQQAYVMVHCESVRLAIRLCVWLSSCASVLALTFSLNIFSETIYQILMKFHRNVPVMILFRIS